MDKTWGATLEHSRGSKGQKQKARVVSGEMAQWL